MEIVFVRHGETVWNTENRLQGQTNESKLTANGIKQAENLAEQLEENNFDVIISSPLDRTVKTASIICKKRKKEIIAEDALLERGYGNLEGEYQKNGKYDIEQLWDYKENYAGYDIEPIQQFFQRIYKFLDNFIKENNYKRVLMVSHSGVGIAFRTYFEGFPEDGNLLKFGIKNCEVVRYNV